MKYKGTFEMLAIINNFVLVPMAADDYRITCRLIEDYNTGPLSINSPRVDRILTEMDKLYRITKSWMKDSKSKVGQITVSHRA